MSEVNGRLWILEGAREFFKRRSEMKLTAAEARKISYETKVNIIYEKIQAAAEKGENLVYAEILHESIIRKLREDGYGVQEMNHNDKYRITW